MAKCAAKLDTYVGGSLTNSEAGTFPTLAVKLASLAPTAETRYVLTLEGDATVTAPVVIGGNDKTEVETVTSEKDFTDTQLAVETAIKRGARDIVIIGGLSGRLDHTLSNLAILKDLCDKQIYCLITDGKNRVRYIRSTSTLISRSGYKYLSLIADGEKIKGVSIEGCKYPLENATLTSAYQYAISNEITGNCALVSVKKGGLYIVESAE